MKKLLGILAAVLFTTSLLAQAPLKMSYQAVIRNNNKALVTNTLVGMRISILNNTNSVYTETQTAQTNANGLVTFEIGTGITSDNFGAINWANGPYFIKTETDPSGGNNYSVAGISELLSVPYALHAKTAEKISGTINYTETDPVFNAWNKSSGINITASQVSDFATSVTNNAAMLANTAKNNYPAADAAKLAAITGTNTGDQDLSGKVDKVTGKGLSTNDYTTDEQTKLAAITGTNTGDQDLSGKEDKTNKVASISGTSTNVQYPGAKLTYDQFGLKVDKVTGKGLSTNDYTTAEQTKVASITGTNTGDQDLSGKVDKVTGKGLSTNDYTTAEQTKVAAITGTNTGDQDLSGKVDKVTGKGLSTNDYPTADAAKLAAITGTNTGDNAVNTTYSGLVTNAAHTGEVNGSNALTIDNAAVIGKVLTGYTSGAGTITATDNILQAIQKLNGNDGGSNATHTGDATGATALTLATVNSNVGTFNNVTVNAKGLATAASNVTYLTSETDPAVKAITGIVKSNGATISAATAGTDYLTPSGSGASLTGITPTQVGAPSGSGTSTGTNTGDQTLPTLSSLGGMAGNTAITGATKTKITYDVKGLVTTGVDATTADIAASTNKNYVTDAQQTVIGNTSGTNTGDQTLSGLGGVVSNTAITGATKTKITYDAKGLVTAGADATTADIAASTDKKYVTDAQQTVISNTSGTNTGDNAINTLYDGLETNATHAGDATGSGLLTIANNAVTDAKFRQGASRSIVGVTGNATANTADIQGTTDQILRVNGTGTVLAFGSIDLSKSATIGTSILPVANGGMGANVTPAGAGEVLYSSSTTAYGHLTAGTSGQVLTSAGAGVPTWETPGAGSGWSLTGNSGTVDGTNFIGTTDDVPFNVRVNNQKAGRIDSTFANTFWGYKAGKVTTGSYNTANGFSALQSNISGTCNTANGVQALFSNTGSYNTANGVNALYSNTSGGSNTANGYQALFSNVAGSNATAIGYNAMYYANNNATPFENDNVAIGYEALIGSATASDNTGNSNTALGYQTLFSNTSGSDNTAIGDSALYSNTTGGFNTANGVQALYSNTGGAGNTAIGFNALYSNTSGNVNTAIGDSALYSNTSGTNNTANGYQALNSNVDGNNNTANGVSALYTNTSGSYNTANGREALYTNTSGSYNTANGDGALYSNVAGSKATAIGYNAMKYANDAASAFDNYNVALGFEALRGSTTASANTGYSNTALGYQTLFSNTSGSDNTAIGDSALYSNTTGEKNTANGVQALYSNVDGSGNTANGYFALYKNTTGKYNTAIGELALYSNVDVDDNTAIGYQALFYNTGRDNTANGYRALYTNTAGIYNTANGVEALYYNETGSYNTAIGSQALNSNVDGTDNTAIGVSALYSNTGLAGTGSYNTAIGESALAANVDGTDNTAIGYQALVSNTGSYNTAIGELALTSNTSGTNNTAIGYGADVLDGISYATAIGSNALVELDNSLVLGDASDADLKVGIGTTQPGARLEVDVDPLLSPAPAIKIVDGYEGTPGYVLTNVNGDGLGSWQAPIAVREVADEYAGSDASGGTDFTLSQTPSASSIVKMYINGIRISNHAYSLSGTTLTYDPTSTYNGSYTLVATDRIQFDYFY